LLPVLFLSAWLFLFFRGFFLADLSHNMAIFFSKTSFWSKGPEFDNRIVTFPPEIQDEYRRIGGAVEHYTETTRLNPYFPMGWYFKGNVYNDWGSQVDATSRAAYNNKDLTAAGALRNT